MDDVGIWMPLYIGDTLAEISQLTTRQFGAYQLFKMEYWRNGPLPNDEAVLRKIARLERYEWKTDGPTVKHYFRDGEDGRLHHAGLDALREQAREKRSNSKARAKKASEIRWDREVCKDAQSNAPSIPPRSRSGIPEHSPSPSQSKSPSSTSGAAHADPATPEQACMSEEVGRDHPLKTLSAMELAHAMFERLCIPAGKTLKARAAEAIRLNAIECAISIEESANRIEDAARNARGRGETIKPWWFEDGKYRKGSDSRANGATESVGNAVQRANEEMARKQRIVEHLEYCAQELEGRGSELRELEPVAGDLEKLAEAARRKEPAFDEAAIEASLTNLEDRMFSVLESVAGPQRISEIEKGARSGLGKRREKMTAKALQHVERQSTLKRLRESFQLPRLSLFYMDANEQARTNVEATHQPIEQ